MLSVLNESEWYGDIGFTDLHIIQNKNIYGNCFIFFNVFENRKQYTGGNM